MRTCKALLSFASICLMIAGCSSVQTIAVTPASGVVTLTAVGQTQQYAASGTVQTGSATPTSSNLTNSVTWTSGTPSVASISAAGLATAVGFGKTTITAEENGIVASSDLTVTAPVVTETLVITPATGLASISVLGQTVQYHATETKQTGSGSLSTSDVTDSVTWGTSTPSVATISSSGLATAVSLGMASITAEADGILASSNLSVTAETGIAPTVVIIPNSAAAVFIGETTQFLALGNLTTGGSTEDLTSQVKWFSSDVSIATIDQAGLATAVAAGTGTTSITAIATLPSGSLITAVSSLSVTAQGGVVNLPTLAIYQVGQGTGVITDGNPGLTCNPQLTCTGNFTKNATVTLTETPTAGDAFGGWSANCAPINQNQCTIIMSNNETVGAIFNKQ